MRAEFPTGSWPVSRSGRNKKLPTNLCFACYLPGGLNDCGASKPTPHPSRGGERVEASAAKVNGSPRVTVIPWFRASKRIHIWTSRLSMNRHGFCGDFLMQTFVAYATKVGWFGSGVQRANLGSGKSHSSPLGAEGRRWPNAGCGACLVQAVPSRNWYHSYSMRMISRVSSPDGNLNRTRWPRRAWLRARAIGDSQLTQPRSTSVSSTPTSR